MAWRFQLSTEKHYLDFEGGRRRPEVQQANAPVSTETPMITYAEPIGFRMTGDGKGFVPDVEATK